MPDWGELFRLSTPVAEIFVRGTVIFLAVFALLRVVGKREAGAYSLIDLLVVVLISEAASHGMAGEARGITDSVLLVATILFWSVALDAIAYRWPALRRVLKSKPSPLVVDGEINPRALRRELMPREELMAQLRLHGITRVEEVARAYIEPNGMISVIRKEQGDGDDPPKPPAVS